MVRSLQHEDIERHSSHMLPSEAAARTQRLQLLYINLVLHLYKLSVCVYAHDECEYVVCVMNTYGVYV